MKKLISISIILSSLIFIFSSCNQYEEGPLISFKSKEKRIAGDYTVSEKIVNGVSKGATSYKFSFAEDGTGSAVYPIKIGFATVETTFDLEWKLSDTESDLLIRTKLTTSNEFSSDWTTNVILKLTDDEIWFHYVDDLNDIVEMHLTE